MGTSILDDCGVLTSQRLARLESPERNHYYYGKLLDAYHLELEQTYGNNKRWLLNRLSLGSGVLCGLHVHLSSDGTRVRISAGVAIDGVGREIIVPVDSPPIDVRQPTDACGRPEGPPARAGDEVTLSICFLECEAEPAPAVVDPCGDTDPCEHGLVRERYRLAITRGRPRNSSLVTPEQCARIFSQPPNGTTRRVVACQTLSSSCDAGEVCVPLAIMRFDDNRRVITPFLQCEARRVLYSNAVLLDLILCLAARVDECCGGLAVRALHLVSGDNQPAQVGAQLAQPIVTRVVDSGNPVANEDVTFDITPGSGAIGATAATLGPSFTVRSNAQGIAACPIWRLGPVAGTQRVTARIASGSPAMVTFVAVATRAIVTLPVVRQLWPTPAIALNPRSPDPINVRWYRDFIGSPRIELSFNVRMLPAHLNNPDTWMRVSLVRSFGQNEIEVRPLGITYAGPAAQPIIGSPGEFTEVFSLRSLQPGHLTTGGALATGAMTHGLATTTAPAAARGELRILVQIRAASGNIVDLATPPQLLDAEFMGARLTLARRTEIFQLTDVRMFPQDVWDALVATGATLPQSGDGIEGGEFTAWFALEPVGS